MATEVRSFQVTFAANTAKTSPVTTDTTFPAMTVDQVNVKVPPGPSGLMGFRFTMNGQQVIPINLGTWIVADDQYITWQLTDLPNSGAWSVEGYNTDPVNDHTIYIEYLLSPNTAAVMAAAAASNAVSASILGSSG